MHTCTRASTRAGVRQPHPQHVPRHQQVRGQQPHQPLHNRGRAERAAGRPGVRLLRAHTCTPKPRAHARTQIAGPVHRAPGKDDVCALQLPSTHTHTHTHAHRRKHAHTHAHAHNHTLPALCLGLPGTTCAAADYPMPAGCTRSLVGAKPSTYTHIPNGRTCAAQRCTWKMCAMVVRLLT